MPPQTPIDIVLASNAAYVPGLFVTAASIAEYASRTATLHFHIFDSGIPDADIATLTALLSERHPHTRVIRYNVTENMFAHCPAWRGNRTAYLRLLVPALMPSVPRIVYSDIDTLWRADISELWHLVPWDAPCAAALDSGSLDPHSEMATWWHRHIPAIPFANYVNSGVLVMNLDFWRREKIPERIVECMTQYHPIPYPDQTGINIALNGRITLLPQQWNCFSRSINVRRLPRPVVIHFAGDTPWRRKLHDVISDPVAFWHRYHATLGVPAYSPGIFITPLRYRLLRVAAHLLPWDFIRRVAWRVHLLVKHRRS